MRLPNALTEIQTLENSNTRTLKISNMNNLDIEYNTEKPNIRFPEYGRSIQEMIQHAITLESPQKRQKTVEAIIGLMIQLGPQGNRNMDDYREKLWNHVFALANYELDVTPPPGIIIRKEEDKPKPEPLGYLNSATRDRKSVV